MSSHILQFAFYNLQWSEATYLCPIKGVEGSEFGVRSAEFIGFVEFIEFVDFSTNQLFNYF